MDLLELEIESAKAGITLTPRIERLRKRALDGDVPKFGWLRAYYYLEGWMAGDGESLPIRGAKALAHVIESMPVSMIPGEILVGEHGGDGDLLNFRASFPRDYPEWIAGSDLDDDQKRRFVEWVKTDPFRWQTLAPVAPWPDELRLAQDRGVVQIWGTDLNHSIRDYEKVLRLGFAGIKAEVVGALDKISPADPDAPHRRANLLGWLAICDAAIRLGARHAGKARELAGDCADPVERADWLAVAEVCERVPAHPARTLREALQSLWFAHMITVWEDGINANGIGRIDQFLLPYFERAVADPSPSPLDPPAFEALAALWIKLYQNYDVQQMMIGGVKPDGSDASNPLSYLVLDVTETLGFVRCLSARLHRGSPRALVSRCVDLVAKGGGIPFFFNDEALVPALVSKGVPIEEARGYAAIGCIEITIPGKANPHPVSHWINLPKCLELALNDGCDLRDGAQVGLKTGTLADFASMDDVLAAYAKQLERFAALAVYGSNSAEIAHKSQYRLPYLSLLTSDCIERGTDILEGGARYNYHSSAAMGIPNAADSLAALDLAVYREKRVSPGELLDALRSDFEGREDLRLLLRNRLPKYGNDDPLPDGYAADLTRQYCELMGSHRTASGGTFFSHLFTFTLMLPMGKMTGASPEGRKLGEPLAYSLSPVQGRDMSGFTATVLSLSKLPHHLAAASGSAILEADSSLLEGPGKEAFVDLLRTAIDMGVGQMQFNVVSAETLRAAQADPERYRSLCVRVSGFSQRFGLLDREMQDHIIARTKHKS